MNKQAKTNALMVLLILGILGVGAYFVFFNKTTPTSDSTLTVLMYDKNMNPIDNNQFSIVSGVPNVYYLAFVASVINNDNVSLTFNVNDFSASPTQLPSNVKTSLSGSKVVGARQTGQWTSSVFNASLFENMATNVICVNISNVAIVNSRNSIMKYACIGLTIRPDVVTPTAINPNYTITITQGPQTPSTPVGFTKGSLCGNTNTISDYQINGCTISVDVNGDNSNELFTFSTSSSLYNPISLGCSNYGNLALSNTPEGLSLRYGPYSTLGNRIFVCKEPTSGQLNGVIVSLQ